MRRWIAFMCCAALGGVACVLSGTARAATDRCGEAVPIVRAALDELAAFETASLSGTDAVLVAQLDMGERVVAFVRRGGRWRGYGIAENAGIQGLYRTAKGEIFIWAYEGQGDPPTGFAGFHVGARPGGQFCTRIGVPADLNKPDWRGEAFLFERFNVTAAGRGTVAGTSRVERDSREQTWRYRYVSPDGGRTWGEPTRAELAAPPAGIYAEVKTKSAALLADLKRAAR